MRHEYEEVPVFGWVVIAILTLVLSFKVPLWIAGYFGWQQAYQLGYAWVMSQVTWIKAPLIFAYMLSGFFILVAMVTAVGTIGYLLVTGIYVATVWLVNAVRVLLCRGVLGMGRALAIVWLCATAPFVFLADRIGNVVKGCGLYVGAVLEERRELRRMYREEYADQFSSFLAFKRYIKGLGEEGEAASSGRDEGRDSGKDETPKTDAYQEALGLFGLREGFGKAEFDGRYRTLMKEMHPDVAGPNDLAARLNTARDLIKKRRGWR